MYALWNDHYNLTCLHTGLHIVFVYVLRRLNVPFFKKVPLMLRALNRKLWWSEWWRQEETLGGGRFIYDLGVRNVHLSPNSSSCRHESCAAWRSLKHHGKYTQGWNLTATSVSYLNFPRTLDLQGKVQGSWSPTKKSWSGHQTLSFQFLQQGFPGLMGAVARSLWVWGCYPPSLVF